MGVVLLQMAFPVLRQDNTLVQFNKCVGLGFLLGFVCCEPAGWVRVPAAHLAATAARLYTQAADRAAWV